MSARAALLLTLLILAGCSRITVGSCGNTITDFRSREQHRSIVIHPEGCYAAWDQPSTPFEAERRAFLFCAEANPKSADSCTVVATDDSICPRGLKQWTREHRNSKHPGDTVTRHVQCDFARAFEAKSAPGTEPQPVVEWTGVKTADVAAFMGLKDYDFAASEHIFFGQTRNSKSNWIVTQALHFVTQKGGEKTCVLKVANGWDPRIKYFDTIVRVNLLGCFKSGTQPTNAAELQDAAPAEHTGSEKASTAQ